MKFNKLFVMAIFVLFTKIAIASAPSLSINPADYSYSQNVTAVLLHNCEELNNPNNMLIAKINGQLRGFVNSSTVVGSRHLAFLTIYSNVPSGDTVKFQIYNADLDSLIDVKTTLVYKDDAVIGSPSLPIEMHTNNRPSNLQLSTLLIPETYSGDPSIATISATDLDISNTLSFALVAGANSTDNNSFKVVGNSLHYNGVVNTGIKDTFKIRLNVADNFGCTFEKEFALIVDKINDAPTNIILSDSTFNENINKPVIGKFSPVDPDLVDKFTYSFVAGLGDTDNGSFLIEDSNIVFNGSANFEIKNKYSIRIKVTDIGGLTFEKAFNFYVEDKNDNPTNIVLSTDKVFENEPLNVFVAKLSSIDEDAIDSYTYTFANIGTNDNANFKIVNDTLKANKVFDYETKNVYNIYLTSTDSLGLLVTKAFSIYIQDTTDAPTDINLSNQIITENLPKNTFIGTISTIDANKQPVKYSYTTVSGKGSDDNASFIISNDSLFSNEAFDYETKSSYTIRVRTTLVNKMYTEKSFVINIKDVVSTNITLSNNKVYENEPATQFVAKISTVSLDNTDAYTYSFGNIGTNDNTTFNISNDSIFAKKVFNYEEKDSYVIYVTSTSKSGLAITRPFTIGIKDSLDTPTDINLSNQIITENLPKNTFIATISTIDANKQPVKYTYSTVTGVGNDDNVSFVISNDSLFSNEAFDYETKSSYTIRVRTTLINNMYTEKSFVINIKDVVSTNITLSNNKVYENEPATQFVAKISTVSLDNTDAYTYSFGNIGTNDNTTFNISNDSIFAKKVFNYEEKDSYVIYVTSTSKSGLAITRPFTIGIKDSLDTPTDINLSNQIITENLPKNTFIATISTIDANKQPVKYTYSTVTGVGSDDNVSFVISNDSLFSNEAFDYETKSSYNIRLRTTLINNMYTEKTFVINIKDVVSTNITLSNNKVYENEPATQFVAKISTVSLDNTDAYTYSFGNIGTNDNTTFNISNDSIFAKKVFNYEEKDSYVIYVTSTSKSGLAITRPFTIGIKDSLDTPTDINLSNQTITENLPKNTFIGTISTIDANKQPVKYTYSTVTGVGSDDNISFVISNDSLFSNEAFDFETKSSYNIRVRTTLINNMYTEKSFVIAIKNQNEKPYLLSISKDSVFENTKDSTLVGSFSTSDFDINDKFVYTLITSNSNNDISNFAIKNNALFLVKPLNFETKSVYNLIVRTSDAGGLTLDSTIVVYVKDVNEKPILKFDTYQINELATKDTAIGTVAYTDDDLNQTYKFELSDTTLPFSIDSTGLLTLTGNIDYETQKEFNVWVKISDNGKPILQDSISVVINIMDEIELSELPSANLVSPNNDGFNDYWKITNVHLYKDYSLNIVDEYGQSVYSISGNYDNKWDAKLNGDPIPSGLYYYVFKNNIDGKLFKGNITVIH